MTRHKILLGLVLVAMTPFDSYLLSEQARAGQTRPKVHSYMEQFLREFERRQKDAESDEDPKLEYGRRRKLMEEIVAKELSNAEFDFRTLVMEIAAADKDDVSSAIFNEVIFFYGSRGDTEKLIAVLSVRCPEERIWLHHSIESLLVLALDEPLKGRGVMILCDAWQQSVSDTNRRCLVLSLRRGFEPIGISSDSDERFVAHVREWYNAHRVGFMPNPDYCSDRYLQGKENVPLFIEKATEGKTTWGIAR